MHVNHLLVYRWGLNYYHSTGQNDSGRQGALLYVRVGACMNLLLISHNIRCLYINLWQDTTNTLSLQQILFLLGLKCLRGQQPRGCL